MHSDDLFFPNAPTVHELPHSGSPVQRCNLSVEKSIVIRGLPVLRSSRNPEIAAFLAHPPDAGDRCVSQGTSAKPAFSHGFAGRKEFDARQNEIDQLKARYDIKRILAGFFAP